MATVSRAPEPGVRAFASKTTVYVVKGTDAWKEAERGDARRLTALIAHELYHVEHGPNERPAYDEELRVLKLLGIRDTRSVQMSRAAYGR